MSGPLSKLLVIFDRSVIPERWSQVKRWGQQTHPDGTGGVGSRNLANFYRALCDYEHGQGTGTWMHILLEEVHEAGAEKDYDLLRAELVQVATVALAWVEDLDNRQHELAAKAEDEDEPA